MSKESGSGPDVASLLSEGDRRWKAETNERLVASLSPLVEEKLASPLMTPVDKIWQPSDVLPNLEGLSLRERQQRMSAFYKENKGLSPGFYIVTAFHGVTEEGLPSFTAGLNRFPGIRDNTGDDDTPWARFLRDWTAEERRHLETITTFLYLSGKVNMKEYERSIQSFLRNGLNPTGLEGRPENFDSLHVLIYAAFQEKNTEIASKKAGQIAKREGSETGYNMFRKIGGDEGRHGKFYEDMVSAAIKISPESVIIAMNDVLRARNGILMPGALMTSGEDTTVGPTKLFKDLVEIEKAMDGFTPTDFSKIFNHLLSEWKIDKDFRVSGQAAVLAKESVLRLQDLAKKSSERYENTKNSKVIELQIPWMKDSIVIKPAA